MQNELGALPFEPETHLRISVTEPRTPPRPEAALFANARRRNGLILVPTKDPDRPVTVELVNELNEDRAVFEELSTGQESRSSLMA